ncbi:MAG: hypothetical protein Q8R98_12185, partial [Rubrivivax sp.]|nr:hypothetical protein [Rubrivivax sp.]
MTSPLLNRLLHTLSTTTDPVSSAVLSAQIACYQARVGEFEDAESRRIELRRVFGDGHSPQVSILVMCLEALLMFFKELDPNARDRLLRANLISVACHERPLIALTSAWMAHLDFNAGRYESMAKSMQACATNLDADDGTAACRLALVLGDAFDFVGNSQTARVWYEDARITASRLGDQAAVGAITYNRAALHVSNGRVKRISGELERTEVALIGGEVKSAINYQAVARLKSLDHLLRSASVGALMLEDRFEEASVAILTLLASSAVPAGSAELALLYADQALCLAKIGKGDQALEMAGAA